MSALCSRRCRRRTRPSAPIVTSLNSASHWALRGRQRDLSCTAKKQAHRRPGARAFSHQRDCAGQHPIQGRLCFRRLGEHYAALCGRIDDVQLLARIGCHTRWPNTALTAGSVTTISDATTGETMTSRRSRRHIATCSTAIAKRSLRRHALCRHHRNHQCATVSFRSERTMLHDGIVVSSNDAAARIHDRRSGTAVANAYAYVGNSSVNTVQVGDSMMSPPTARRSIVHLGGQRHRLAQPG
jgi:hypothetical protein